VTIAAQVETKPRLRGWSHLVAAFGAVGFSVALAVRSADDPPRLVSMLVYGVSMVALYAGSAAYHVGTWPAHRERILRRFDHGNIFLLIAGTSTAIGFNVLDDPERAALLTMVWILAGAGLALTMITPRLPRWARAALYTGTGLVGLLALPTLMASLPAAAILTGVLGGVLYTVGATIYALGRPNPLPGLFGHHEIFHLFVIAGGVAFGAAIWIWIVPFPRP
jgi:hemolysin III